jgi:hypothetical protein
MGTRGILPGSKVARHEADHSPPSSTEIKNDWSYDSTPPIYLHGMHRGNFAFYFIILIVLTILAGLVLCQSVTFLKNVVQIEHRIPI